MKVSGCWAAHTATCPRAPCRYRLPGLVLLDLCLPADSLIPGGETGPGGQLLGCREDAHVGAGLGDDHVGDAGADSRDGAGQVPEGLKGFDHHLDPGGELIDLTLLSHLVNEASVAGRAGEGESLTHGLKAPIHGSRGALHPDADLRAHRHHRGFQGLHDEHHQRPPRPKTKATEQRIFPNHGAPGTGAGLLNCGNASQGPLIFPGRAIHVRSL